MQKEIREATAELQIDNLIDRASGKEDEIRIWVGFGLTYPRLFILRQTNGKPEALHITVTTASRRTGAGGAANPTPIRTLLGTPKSGWDEFERFLKSHGIESPIHLTRERDYVPNPDGRIIVFESKSGAEYSVVFFHLDNNAADALKAISVCQRLEKEFSIAMHCGPR